MVDSVTNNYGLTLPTVGGDSGTWGGIQNNGIFTPIDNILGANYSFSVTSLDVTLTTTQFQNAVFIVNGTLTGAHNVVLPFANNGTSVSATTCVGGKFIVVNNGTGAFNLSVKTATTGGLSAIVPQGFAASLYSDGVNVGYAANGLPGFAQAVNGNPNGQLAGTAGSVNTNAQLAYDYTNNMFYLCTASGTAGSATWATPSVPVPRGFDPAINLSFTTSASANLLTVTALAANINSTPTVANPITIIFGDSTITNGDPVTINATTALSISTFTTGASLGATNSVPFRFWIAAFNNGGALVLGLINCSTTTQVYPLNESVIASTVGMTATATLPGTFYTPSGVSVAAGAFRILGYLEYSGGLVTAGTYNNGPTSVRLFGAGSRKPGDVITDRYSGVVTATTNISNVQTQTPVSATIAPSSTVNLVRASSNVAYGGGSSGSVIFQISRGAAPTLIGTKQPVPNFSVGGSSMRALDAPASTSTLTYYVYGINSGASASPVINSGGASSDLLLEEIMG